MAPTTPLPVTVTVELGPTVLALVDRLYGPSEPSDADVGHHAAAMVMALDPAAVRQAVAALRLSAADDPYAATLNVIADLLAGPC